MQKAAICNAQNELTGPAVCWRAVPGFGKMFERMGDEQEENHEHFGGTDGAGFYAAKSG
jgi:hypothetical protein